MRCAAVSLGESCSAESYSGVGWLQVVTPDGKRYALCSLHKLGGEVCVQDAEGADAAMRMESLRRLAAREFRLDEARRTVVAEVDANPPRRK